MAIPGSLASWRPTRRSTLRPPRLGRPRRARSRACTTDSSRLSHGRHRRQRKPIGPLNASRRQVRRASVSKWCACCSRTPSRDCPSIAWQWRCGLRSCTPVTSRARCVARRCPHISPAAPGDPIRRDARCSHFLSRPPRTSRPDASPSTCRSTRCRVSRPPNRQAARIDPTITLLPRAARVSATRPKRSVCVHRSRRWPIRRPLRKTTMPFEPRPRDRRGDGKRCSTTRR